MSNQYYVQEIAENYLRNVVDDPEELMVHSQFLHGIEVEQFHEGFLALLTFVRSLYSDIIKKPGDFGVLLKEIIEPDAKNADYTKSNASIIRYPNLLLAMGANGLLQPDMSLLISGEALLDTVSLLKITGLTSLLDKLGEYGVKVSGYEKSVKAKDNIRVTYSAEQAKNNRLIDSRYLTVALKSMSDALLLMNNGDYKKSKNHFFMMNYKLLEKYPVKEPKPTIENIYHVLNDENKKIAAILHNFIKSESRYVINMGGFMRNDWKCVYTGTKSKKVIMSIIIVQDKMSVKLNLQNIGHYANELLGYPEQMREPFKSGGWDCGRCHDSCLGGFVYELEGKSYNKCRGGSFVFEDLSIETADYCLKLLEHEMRC